MKKAIYAENYGCTSNRHDLEIMLGLLEQAGHIIVDDVSEADVLIINTCAVKEPTQIKVLHRIAKLRDKPLIISGCLPKIDLESIEHVAPGYCAVLDPQSIHHIPSIVEHVNQTRRNLKYFSDRPPEKPTLPKKRLNPYVEIVQIAEGCLGNCSYCCARHARGRLHSFPERSIVERVRNAVSNGAKEIWITAQDTGAYGLDRETNLTELLENLVKINGDFRIRIGMMNPNHAKTILNNLIGILKDPKVYKFVHIPAQSGSTKVLKDMNREYNAEEFVQLAKTLRERIPDLTLSTDIIVGYPTETEQDFESTINLITETRPDITNISKYGQRPETEARRLLSLPRDIINTRSRTATSLCSKISLERNQQMIGQTQQTTPTEESQKGKTITRTDNYKKTIINQQTELGKKILIKITRAFPKHIEATVEPTETNRIITFNPTIRAVQADVRRV